MSEIKEIEKIKIEELNTLPLHKRLAITNHYQARTAQYTCSNCEKQKLAIVHILFARDYEVGSLLCTKCYNEHSTMKKLGPLAKRLKRR